VGKRLGKLVKTDVCTSFTLRGRYALICVEVSMGVPVKKSVHIGQHKQPIIYEGSDIFCNRCGVLGHNAINCVVPQTNQQNMQAMEIRQGDNARGSDVQTSTPYMADPKEKWQTVTFNRQKKENKRTPEKINDEPA
ncbi:hypothetical protein AABB24_013068, partial [Solanum stoloniferum]